MKLKVEGRSSGFLIIPLDVMKDKNLSDATKLLYGELKRLEFKGEGKVSISINDLEKALNKSKSQIIRITNQLLRAGWLQKKKTSYGGTNQYTLIDPAEIVYQDLIAFMSITQIFKSINLQSLLKKYNTHKLLNVLEVFEYTYRKSNKPINDPLKLISYGMTKAVVPDEGFKPGWWKKRIEVIEKQKQEIKKDRIEAEQIKKENEDFKQWLKALSEDEYKDLRKRAIDNLKSNGGIPAIGAEITIKNKMFELSLGRVG